MMFSKSHVALVALAVLSSSQQAVGRMTFWERGGRPVTLSPRRFGQQNPPLLAELSQACAGEVCGTLSGQAVAPLLAGAGICDQQNMADQIIDAAQQFDAATKANMIAIAVEYRQLEKNTPPDFSVNPNILRNSLFCQEPPKNQELNGLFQAQDPANDPDAFFDPRTSSTVQKGSIPETFPLGSSGSVPAQPAAGVPPNGAEQDQGADCETVVTVTVTSAPTDATATDVPSTTSTAGATPTTSPPSGGIGNFGSCSVPQIIFAAGLDNRRETAFEPADKQSYPHGSAQAIGIITQFICDTLTNTCGADQTAKDTCKQAQQAVNGAPAKTGGQADLFNAAFGITTEFANVVALDDKGEVVPGTGSPNATPNANTPAPLASADFGKCTVPEIKFAAGLDGRKETAFEPADKQSFPHDSAQNIDIITQFICDTLTNTCAANAAAKAECQQARAAASAAPVKTGAQADAFNAVFGVQTDFASVPAIDNQGNVVPGTGASTGTGNGNDTPAPSSTTAAAPLPSSSSSAAETSTAVPSAAPSAAAPTGDNLQQFTGALGGVVAPRVTALANGEFAVEGNASFKELRNARVRSCDVQNNQCANKANASGNKDLTVQQCNAQQQECIQLAQQQ